MLGLEELRQSCNLEYEEEKDSDTVDPGLLIDDLPQPYRNVDFLLNEIICNAYNLYIDRFEKRKLELSRPKVSSLECEAYIFRYGLPDVILSDLSSTLLFSVRNEFIAVDCASYSSKNEKSEKENPKIYTETAVSLKLAATVTLIGNKDTSGKISLYGVSDGVLFLLWTSKNENTGAESVHPQSTFTLSKDGSFIGISFTAVTDQVPYVDIYSLPKENWVKEITELADKNSSNKEEQGVMQPNADLAGQENHLEDVLNGDGANQASNENYFSKPVFVMKISSVIPGSKPTVLNLGSALKSVEGENAIVGSGLSHLLTTQFCENYNSRIEQKYHQYVSLAKTAPDISVRPPPVIAFLTPVKRGGISSAISYDTAPAMVAVASNQLNQVHGYYLSKPGRDNTKKPDLVIPNCAQVRHMAVSGCTTLLAVLTDGGHLIIWNRQLARVLKIEWIPEEKTPKFFKFSSIEGRLSTEERLLLGISSGDQQFVQIHCSYYECSNFIQVNDRSCLEPDGVVNVMDCPVATGTVAALRQSGRVTFFDLMASDAVAHIQPPDGFKFCFTPKPCMCFTESCVFVKAIRTNVKQDLDDDKPEGGVLVFSIEGINAKNTGSLSLQKASERSSIFTSVPAHKDWKSELLKSYRRKDERQKHLKMRWSQFKHDLVISS